MSISFGPMVHDNSRDRFLAAAAPTREPDDFELNVCNGNGIDLLLHCACRRTRAACSPSTRSGAS